MGRWAQRTRQGGTVNNFSSMQVATITQNNPGIIVITYNTGGNLSLLSAADFTSQPSGEVGTFQVVSGTNELTVQFGADISGDTEVEYAGSVVNFYTPQTLAYT